MPRRPYGHYPRPSVGHAGDGTVYLQWLTFANARRRRSKQPATRIGHFSCWLEEKANIDKAGKVVIKPQFDAAYGFREGLARVLTGENADLGWVGDAKCGYVDKTGKYVWEPTK